MKAILLSLLVLFCINGKTQNEFNQLVVSGGPTYSMLRGVHKAPFLDYEKNFDFTLGFQGHIDYGFLRRLSVGLGYTQHNHRLNIFDYQFDDDGQTVTEDPTQTIFVKDFYLRLLIHSLNVYDDYGLDVYGGVQQHFMSYRTVTTSKDPEFFGYNGSFSTIPGVLVGIRYYPIDWLGIYAECAIPGAYTFSAGLVFKTPGRSKFLK